MEEGQKEGRAEGRKDEKKEGKLKVVGPSTNKG